MSIFRQCAAGSGRDRDLIPLLENDVLCPAGFVDSSGPHFFFDYFVFSLFFLSRKTTLMEALPVLSIDSRESHDLWFFLTQQILMGSA
jgi:hypothetical protein